MSAHDPLGIEAMRADIAHLTQLVERLVEKGQPGEYTVAQVAKLWNKSPRTIHRYIAGGRIEVIRHGNTPMIPRKVVSQGVPQSPKQ